jgi:hypothetical protein
MSEEDTNVRNPLITIIEEKYKNYYSITNNNSITKNNKQLLVESTNGR